MIWPAFQSSGNWPSEGKLKPTPPLTFLWSLIWKLEKDWPKPLRRKQKPSQNSSFQMPWFQSQLQPTPSLSLSFKSLRKLPLKKWNIF